jgi:hypothetical protein
MWYSASHAAHFTFLTALLSDITKTKIEEQKVR